MLGRPIAVMEFLRIAIPLAAAVGRLHARGLIHKDLKPANILVDTASSSVWLTGFGIASRLPREHQMPAPPEIIAGTLAYMAPEQTGRINRSIDSRSDLYALGIIFYEMLTGALPFTAADPMEWVHCHVARQPVPPNARVAGIPGPLSALVLKLLTKTADERYQTAEGLAADLQHCLAEWQTTDSIAPFPLGQQDVSDRLLIPERLYGRERDIETLLAAFDRVVAQGAPELVPVSGYSGIGKSSVVNELHKALVLPRDLFASGEFDQYKRDIPYATLAQAFQSLVRPLLGQSQAALERWREAIREALGPNGQLIVNLVSELELVIGEQPPVPELRPQDAQNRFQMVFRRFLGVFAKPEHPLALFLDDLQWLDMATLDLLEHLVTHSEVRHLLLIGAYRDNEVGPAHALLRTLEAIRSAGARSGDRARTARPRGYQPARGRCAALPAGTRTAFGATGAGENRRQSVLRDPVLYGAGRGGVARLRSSRAGLAMGYRSYPCQELHRQCGRARGGKTEVALRQQPGSVETARLPGQYCGDRHAGPGSRGNRGGDACCAPGSRSCRARLL